MDKNNPNHLLFNNHSYFDIKIVYIIEKLIININNYLYIFNNFIILYIFIYKNIKIILKLYYN